MTPAQAKELLPVLAAYSEGRLVQWRVHLAEGYWERWEIDKWRDYDPNKDGEPYQPGFEDPRLEWRVAPSPRDWWLCPSCLHGYAYPEREHLGTFQCGRCSVNVVRVREVVA